MPSLAPFTDVLLCCVMLRWRAFNLPAHLHPAVLRCAVQVRLVLEYCDKGCLRAALDDGVFVMGGYLHRLTGRNALAGRCSTCVCRILDAAGICRLGAQSGYFCRLHWYKRPAYLLSVCLGVLQRVAASTTWRSWTLQLTWPRRCCTCTASTCCTLTCEYLSVPS